MKFLVISDTHGRSDRLSRLLVRHRDVDGIFFLGDGLAEVEAAAIGGSLPTVFSVRGNCDPLTSPYGCLRDEEMTVTLGGHRILLLHGHTVGVKGGLGGAIALAHRREASILLFGHTHLPHASYLPEGEGGPLWLFNPGSLGRPADGAPSYGLLTLDGRSGVLLSHGKEE